MKIEEQIKKCKEMMETEVKVTKLLYKAFDSYNRKQRWILKELIKSMRGEVFSISGSKELYVEETK